MTPEQRQKTIAKIEQMPPEEQLRLLRKTVDLMVEQSYATPPGPFGGNCSLPAYLESLQPVAVATEGLIFNEEEFNEMMDRLCEAIPDEVSSIEELSLYYDIFKKGYQYAVDKACEWLRENIYQRVYECGDRLGYPTADFLKDFRKAMEE